VGGLRVGFVGVTGEGGISRIIVETVWKTVS
jgi:hypothetical protein